MELRDRLLADLERRFWAKVDKTPGDGCWLWRGGGSIYGHIGVAGRTVSTHVLAYELGSGEPIPDGALVLHRCDVPKCVRFDHLFLGTHSDNLRDMWAKGRNAQVDPATRPRGERHKGARLTEADVLLAREMYALGGTRLIDLAERFNVGVSTIHDAVTGKKWKHLPLSPARVHAG